MLVLSLAAVALLRPASPPVRPAHSVAFAPVLAVASDSIRGRVVDSTGTPVAAAQVTLVELARAATTDSRGGFVFGEFPVGRYTVVARASAMRRRHAPFSRRGRTPPVDIRLTRIATDIEPVA